MRIGFLGDTILSDEAKVGPRLKEVLQSTSFNIANLEGPFIGSGSKPRARAGMHQLTHSVNLLKELNVVAVSLANNHMMDFGDNTIVSTKKHLNDNGIGCFGAGKDSEDANQPFEIELGGELYRFYGAMQRYYSAHHFATTQRGGVAQYRPSANRTKGEHLGKAVRNVLFLHWNQEFEDYPEPESKRTAELLTESFDLIVGSHPHCVQGISHHGRSSVVYSLGNFILPHRHYFNTSLNSYTSKSYQSMVVIWDADNQTQPVTIVPCTVSPDGQFIEMADADTESAIREKLLNISEPLLLDGADYRRFYLKNRVRKNRPVLTRYEIINRIKIGIYMGIRQFMLYVEIKVASLLDAMGMRTLMRRMLSLFIPRYR